MVKANANMIESLKPTFVRTALKIDEPSPHPSLNMGASCFSKSETAELANAIQRGEQTDQIPRLIAVGASAKKAFNLACIYGHTELVRRLINSPTSNADFQMACKYGNTEIVRLLLNLPLERGVDPAANDNKALRVASENGHTEIVRLLLNLPLERGVRPAAFDNETLRVASAHGHTEIVHLLLDLPLERCVAAQNNVSLRYACHNGHTEIVRLLLDLPLERGVAPAANDNEALRSACAQRRTGIVNLLLDLPLERGVSPGANDNEALRNACEHGHMETVRILLDLPRERGVDPCSFYALGYPAWGRTDIVRLLLDRIDVIPPRILRDQIENAQHMYDIEIEAMLRVHGLPPAIRKQPVALREIALAFLACQESIAALPVLPVLSANIHAIALQTQCEIESVRIDAELSLKPDATESDAGLQEMRAKIADLEYLGSSTNDKNALDVACERGFVESVRYLLNEPNDAILGVMLHVAVNNGHSRLVRMLLAEFTFTPSRLQMCICNACALNHAEIVRELINVQPTLNSNSILSSACELRQTDVIRVLLERRGLC